MIKIDDQWLSGKKWKEGKTILQSLLDYYGASYPWQVCAAVWGTRSTSYARQEGGAHGDTRHTRQLFDQVGSGGYYPTTYHTFGNSLAGFSFDKHIDGNATY